MLEQINSQNILFLDIEMVPQHPHYAEVPDSVRRLWELKSKQISKNENDTPLSTYNKAAIYAEFGKIVCISCGYFTSERKLRIKSFYGDDEKKLLNEFADLLNKFFSRSDQQLCAHNGKEFDFPYIARRMVINSIKLPSILEISGKKPWEVCFLDTMELWKFGDYKNYTSLVLLASVLGVQTPKDDIDGSMVWDVYWNEKNLERIVAYCEKDVLTVAQIFLRYRNEELLKSEDVESANKYVVKPQKEFQPVSNGLVEG